MSSIVEITSSQGPLDEIPSIKIELEHPVSNCPNSGTAWTVTLQPIARGLMDVPRLRCIRCGVEPAEGVHG